MSAAADHSTKRFSRDGSAPKESSTSFCLEYGTLKIRSAAAALASRILLRCSVNSPTITTPTNKANHAARENDRYIAIAPSGNTAQTRRFLRTKTKNAKEGPKSSASALGKGKKGEKGGEKKGAGKRWGGGGPGETF